MAKKSNKSKKTKTKKNVEKEEEEEREEEKKDEEDEEEEIKVQKKPTKKAKEKAKKSAKKKAAKKAKKEEKNQPQKGRKNKKSALSIEESEDEKEEKQTTTVISKAGAVVDPFVSNSKDYHVILDKESKFNGNCFSATLNKSDLFLNNNKYYILQLIESDTSPGTIYFFTRWGRVGAPGQNKLDKLPLDLGIKAFLSKYREKKRGGYQEIVIDYSDDKEKTPKKTKKGAAKKKKSKRLLDPQVEEFIKLIYNTNIMNIQMKEIGYDSAKMPLGKLGKQTLNEGFEILKEIEVELKKKSPSHSVLSNLSSQFYTKIPHNFGFQRMENFILDTKEKLKAKIEMIESLGDITIATKIISDEKEEDESKLLFSYYKKLHCEIKPINPKEKIYDILNTYLTAKSKTTTRKLKLLEAFEIEREGEKERFNEKIGNKRLLWHGTRITNYVGILSQGLRIAPPEAPSSGYLFGKGLYFADMALKSCWYCYPVNKIGLILLVETALGKIDERIQTDYTLPSSLKKGCNSIQGLGRCVPEKGVNIDKNVFVPLGNGEINPDASLGFNEFIVYNVNQARLRYVLKIQFD